MTATDYPRSRSVLNASGRNPRWEPTLASFAALLAVLAGPAIALSLLDDRQVLGVNTWIKPIKFLISTAIYVFTIAWAFQYVNAVQKRQRSGRFVVIATVGASVVEMLIIGARAALAQQSHFNTGTLLDAFWYYVMAVGAVILVSTSAVTGRMIWQAGILDDARRWAWSSGLVLAGTFGAVTGMAMGSRNDHAVGAAAEMRSLPFVGWSTTIGDLRIAHFLALHSMFVLPLVGAVAVRVLKGAYARRAVQGAAVLWAVVVVGSMVNAFLARPI